MPRLVLCILMAWSAVAPTQSQPTGDPATATAVGERILSVADIETEIREFRAFFARRFADVEFSDYRHGVHALPQDARKRRSWEMLNQAPPTDALLERGRDIWMRLDRDGRLHNCLRQFGGAERFPVSRQGRIVTLDEAVERCSGHSRSSSHGRLLQAYYASRFASRPVDIDFQEPVIRAAYSSGRRLFWSRRGQQNLSCASCHVANAGNRLGDEVLSAALGHGTGFPAMSLKHNLPWFITDPTGVRHVAARRALKPLISLRERYDLCLALSGAAAFADSRMYSALETYQRVLNQGIPLSAPALRH